MNKQKSQIIAMSVFAALFGVGTVVLAVFSVINRDQSSMQLFVIGTVLVGILFIAFLLIAAGTAAQLKKLEKNKARPDSIAALLTREGTEYTRYTVLPDAEKQSSDRATTNAIGVATFLFLGVGFFSFGKTTVDLYISDKDIYINQPKNIALDDGKFNRIAAADIAGVDFRTVGKNERVTIALTDNRGALAYDFVNAAANAQNIRDAFAKLTARTVDPFAHDTQAVFCSNCGAKINADSTFCTNCGYSMKNEKTPDATADVSDETTD